jgi:hypothetical protein
MLVPAAAKLWRCSREPFDFILYGWLFDKFLSTEAGLNARAGFQLI